MNHPFIQDCPCLDTRQLNAVLNQTHELRSLSLITSSPLVEDHSAIARHCPMLNHLELVGNSHLSNSDLIAISGSCANIKRLRLERCPGVGNDGVWAAVGRLPLKELELVGCDGLGRDLFAQGPTSNWYLLRDSLQNLSLNACQGITNQSVEELGATGCLASLKQLDISHNMNIDDSSILALGSGVQETRSQGRRPRGRTLLVYVFQTGVTKKYESSLEGVELMF